MRRANCWCAGPSRCWATSTLTANRAALDDAGWFSTGDVGVVDGAGFVTITGRLKDVINRGGEKFSARDIEDLLVAHPAVRQAAVVPGPDARFGEVPVAFVVFDQPGQASAEDLSAPPARHRTGPPKDARRMAFRGRLADDAIGQGQEVRAGRNLETNTVERQG